ncbi:MAG: hypothetical protein HY827_09920 [Actinobacteria bacterium]|nr:hypothetical protein [Actinomycetota bacterium]
MSAAAVSHTGSGRGVGQTLFRHLDFVVLGAALPVFALAGWSLVGYAVTAAVWTAQALLVIWLENKAESSRNPRTIAGLLVGGSIARAWIAAIAILTTGLALGDAAGLACALLLLALFTVYFVSKMIVHYFFTPAEAR